MNLEEIIDKISSKSKLPKDKIWEKIKRKKEDLGGLITDEGAAYIIAKDLGVDILEPQSGYSRRLKIKDLVAGMNSVSITGVVKNIIPPKFFDRTGGRKGAVSSAILSDETGDIRVVFWDEKTRPITSGSIKEGRVIKIVRGYVREGRDGSPELNVGSKSSILYPKDTGLEKLYSHGEVVTDFSSLKPGQFLGSIAGVATRISPVTEFNRSDGSIGHVRSVTLQGENGIIRVAVWGDLAFDLEGIEEGSLIQFFNVSIREGRGGELEAHTLANTKISLEPDFEFEFPEVESQGPVPIADLSEGMFNVEVIGEVVQVFPETSFERADGSKGFVKSVILKDNSGSVRVSFWDDRIKDVQKVKEGDTLKISKAYTRTGRFGINLNVGSKSVVEVNPEGVILPEMPVEPVKISDVVEDQYNIIVLARVLNIGELKEFERPDGSKGKLHVLTLADETGSIRTVFWDDAVDKLKGLKEGDLLLVKGAYSKPGLNNSVELHAGKLASVIVNPKEFTLPEVSELKEAEPKSAYLRKNISDLKPQDRAEILGTIVYVFSKSIVYPACPECYRKAEFSDGGWLCANCGQLENVSYRMILSVTIDDGTGTIRANLIGRVAEDLLGLTAEEAHNMVESGKESDLNSKIQSLIAKTFLFRGKVFFSDFSQDNEFNVVDFKKVNTREEVETVLDSFSE